MKAGDHLQSSLNLVSNTKLQPLDVSVHLATVRMVPWGTLAHGVTASLGSYHDIYFT